MDSGKNLWKLAGIGGGVVLTMLFVVALGRVATGQTPTRYVRSQLLSGNGIGVTVRDVDAADVKREKLPAESGAVIDDVRSDGPAAKAGLKAGDVIVELRRREGPERAALRAPGRRDAPGPRGRRHRDS